VIRVAPSASAAPRSNDTSWHGMGRAQAWRLACVDYAWGACELVDAAWSTLSWTRACCPCADSESERNAWRGRQAAHASESRTQRGTERCGRAHSANARTHVLGSWMRGPRGRLSSRCCYDARESTHASSRSSTWYMRRAVLSVCSCMLSEPRGELCGESRRRARVWLVTDERRPQSEHRPCALGPGHAQRRPGRRRDCIARRRQPGRDVGS